MGKRHKKKTKGDKIPAEGEVSLFWPTSTCTSRSCLPNSTDNNNNNIISLAVFKTQGLWGRHWMHATIVVCDRSAIILNQHNLLIYSLAGLHKLCSFSVFVIQLLIINNII